MLKDLQYAIRQLVTAPAFTIIAVLTIALGMGANTAIFSVVNGVLLNPLPYPDAARIAVLFEDIPNFKEGSISYPNFLDWQRMNGSFSRLAAYRPTGYNLSGRGEPDHVHGEMISAGFFEILGVKPMLGRTFNQTDDRQGAAPTVLISEGLWKGKFGSIPDIIGQRMNLDGIGRTVIGVIPASFHLHMQNFQSGASLNDVYTPVGEYNEPKFYGDRGAGWGMRALGLLNPGVTIEAAQQDMDRVSRQLTADYPSIDSNERAYVVSLKENLIGDMRLPLLVLLCAVFFVLLIACVNVSNLLLARSIARQREFAIRIAIGAGQWRIIRQLLTESILLAAIGGGLGLLLARFATVAALAAAPHTLPRAEEIGLDLRVLLVTALVSLIAGAAFGLAPALKMRRANLDLALKETGRSIARGQSRMQRVLVIVEIALAVVLLVGAGLTIRTLFTLLGLDPGFNPHSVMNLSIAPPQSLAAQSPAGIRAFLRQTHSQLALTPGVQAASLSAASTPMDSDYDWYIWFAGRPKPPNLTDLPMALAYVVEADYLKTFQIPLKSGRFFTADDNENSSPVVVIDDALARKYFRGQNPIGQFLDAGIEPSRTNGRRPHTQIVGVVGHVNQWGLGASESTRPLLAQIYLPLYQTADADIGEVSQNLEAYVRGQHSAPPDFEVLRRRLLLLNHGLVAYNGQSMAQVVSRSVADKRFSMSLLAVFAACALLLASIGIYGVLSHFVGQRTREIGIRIALGASRREVLGMVLTDGARMILVGIVFGIATALVLTQLMSNMLFGVQPTDFATYLLVVMTLCSIAVLACYIPARRATAIDPLIVLRDE